MRKLYDITPKEEKEIITAGEKTIDNITYKAQPLGDDLTMIWAYIDGERQRTSIGVQLSKLEQRITQFELKDEKLTKQVQVRFSERMYNEIKAAADLEKISVADYIRITIQQSIEKEKAVE